MENTMTLKEVKSHQELQQQIQGKQRAFLLLFKSGSSQSDCAYNNLKALEDNNADVSVFYADVNEVRDIHPEYSITTAPSLLVFEEGNFTKAIKGCQGKDYYKGLFENAVFVAQSGGKKQKSVIVYTTPTCPHCNSLKTYLRKNSIPFRDVDVSKNQREAEEMVRRSGQQGVPQANINGQIVVGFNKKRINELLELR